MTERPPVFVPSHIKITFASVFTAQNSQAPSRWTIRDRPVVVGVLYGHDGSERDVEVELTNEEATALEEVLKAAGARAR